MKLDAGHLWSFSGVLLAAGVVSPVSNTCGHFPKHHSLSNMKSLATSLLIYSTDYDMRLPKAENWAVTTMPYLMKDFMLDDPMLPSKSRFGFAFYKPLSRLNVDSVDNSAEIPLIIQSEVLRRNANSDLRGLPITPRVDGKKDNYVFLSMSAKTLDRSWAKAEPLIRLKAKP